MLKKIVSILAVVSIQLMAIECGNSYTVQHGDSLSLLAKKVYGDSSKWNLIYSANQNEIGDNPSKVSAGTRIRIPCITVFDPDEGSGEAERDPFSSDFHVEILTAEMPPYMGKELPRKGMLLHITDEIFKQYEDTTYSVDWVEDWTAHTNTLLKKRKYDIGPGWYKPDCSDMSSIPESQKIRCEYVFSKPINKEIITFFTTDQYESSFDKFSDLKNKTVCQPEGYLLFNYEDYGLKNGQNFTLLEEDQTIETCIRRLHEGAVDFVAANKLGGDKVISELGFSKEVVNKSSFPFDFNTMHYIIHKSHPDKEVLMLQINKAIDKLKRKGILDTIKSKHIADFSNNL